MFNPIAIVKSHPMPTAIVLIFVVIAFVMIKTAGGSLEGGQNTISATGGADNGAAAVALQQIQSQSAAQQFNIQAQKDVALGGQAIALELAKIDAQNKSAALVAGTNVAMEQLRDSSAISTQQNTLQAQIQGQQIQAQSDATKAQYATLASQITSQSDLAKTSINAQVQIAQINKKKTGLFSWLLG